MGFLSDLNRKRKKVQKKILNPFVKGFSKVSDKFLPNELRWAMPYAAGIGSLMLPGSMGPLYRALAASGMNVAGQIAADETPIEDISDLNELSIALAGGLGALGSDSVAGSMRGGIDKGVTGVDQFGDVSVPYTEGPGFLQGAENVAREGVASLSDYVTGGRQTLADIGKNPGDLFKRTLDDRPGIIPGTMKQFPVLQDAAMALTPTVAQGTGDVAYEMAIDYKNQFDADQAKEMEEAGLGMDQIQKARAAAIRAGLEDNNYSEEEIEVIFERLGLTDWLDVEAQAPYEAAKGGLIGLARGGMPQMEMDYRGGGFIPVGSRERADDVPARLSKNEFVMTADAVRAAGGGSVNKGAQRMYDLMNNLEARA